VNSSEEVAAAGKAALSTAHWFGISQKKKRRMTIVIQLQKNTVIVLHDCVMGVISSYDNAKLHCESIFCFVPGPHAI
jgi:hypothetical protein